MIRPFFSPRCGFCGLTFATGAFLSQHKRQEHFDNDPKQKQPCPICGKEYHSLTQHMEMVHGDEECSCDKCGMQFNSLKALKKHSDR